MCKELSVSIAYITVGVYFSLSVVLSFFMPYTYFYILYISKLVNWTNIEFKQQTLLSCLSTEAQAKCLTLICQ